MNDPSSVPPENAPPPVGVEPGAELSKTESTPADVSPSGPPRKSQARSERPREEGPYAWFAKAAVRRIAAGDGLSTVPTRLAVYVALCTLASDHSSATFQASMASIASRAGLTPRATRDAVAELENIGLVAVVRADKHDKLKLPSHYTILSVKPPPKGTEYVSDGVRKHVPEGVRKHVPRGYGNKSRRSGSDNRRTREVASVPFRGGRTPLPQESSDSDDNSKAPPTGARSGGPLEAAARAPEAPQGDGRSPVHKRQPRVW